MKWRLHDVLRAGVWVLAALVTVPGNSARASGEGSLEEIAAVVGDTPILRSEVEEQAQALAEQYQISPADTATYRQVHRDVLERLVHRELMLLEAEAQGLTTTPDEVSVAVEEAIQNNIRQLGGREGFDAQLRREGLTEAGLRERYREEAQDQILIEKLQQRNVYPRVTVPEDAARRFYEENRSQLPKKPRSLRIQDLFVLTRPDSVIERRARERAAEIRREIVGGLPFQEAAAKYSDDPRGEEGGMLGRFEPGSLDPALDEAAFSLSPGEVSQPLASRFGYHLVQVADRDSAGQWADLRHILVAAAPARADEVRARERAQEIYQQIVSGEIDFAEAIRRYSDDAESRSHEGDLGWIPIESFFGDMRGVVDTLRVGRISPPVPGDGGFHIFKVIGEQAEGTYAFEEIQDQLRQLARQQAMEDVLVSWLDELQKKYYVEIRASW